MKSRGLALSERSESKGFTLFETMVVAAVALIAGAFLVSILISNTGLTNTEKSMVSQGLSTNDSIREIDNYIRQAVGIVSGYPEVFPTYVSGTNTIVVKLPAINSQGTISNTYDYVVFTKDNTSPTLLKEYIFPDSFSIRAPADKLLSNILDSVEFTYLDKNENIVSPTYAEKVKTQIIVLSKNGSANSPRSATIITSLRNL